MFFFLQPSVLGWHKIHKDAGDQTVDAENQMNRPSTNDSLTHSHEPSTSSGTSSSKHVITSRMVGWLFLDWLVAG